MQSRNAGLEELRSQIARIGARIGTEGVRRAGAGVIPFGVAAIDTALPAGGLACGALHEVAGVGPDTEHGCAAALLAAGILGRGHGTVLWVVERPGLFVPALSQVGLHPDRVMIAQAGRPEGVLLTMEEGLRHRGLGGVVGELGSLTLLQSRRLQLAAETSGVLAIAVRRSRRHDDPTLSQPIAAATRWRIAMLPSPPPLPHAPDIPGLAPARWRLELTRCRGGQPASWIVEACDAKGRLRLVADLAHGSAAPAPRRGAVTEPAAGDVAA